MTTTIGRGGTIVLDAVFSDGAGTLVDPVGPTVEVLDPSDVQLVPPTAPDRNPSTGRYEYDFAVAADADLGVYTARWSGTVNGVLVTDDDLFIVADAGGVGFDSVRLADVDELETRSGVTFSVADSDRAAAVLDDVSALVLAEGDSTWTAATVPAVVRTVVLSAAYRAFSNPTGFVSEQVGDYSYRLGDDVTSGVSLTRAELRLVRRASARLTVGSLRMERPEVNRIADDLDL